MSLVGKIAERDGALFVVYETTLDSQPIRRTLWWRVRETRRNPWNMQHPEAGDTATSLGGGVWNCHREGSCSKGSVSFHGDAQAEFVEESDVPAPKVRRGVEVRWYRGRWEKLLKSQGWVSA